MEKYIMVGMDMEKYTINSIVYRYCSYLPNMVLIRPGRLVVYERIRKENGLHGYPRKKWRNF